MHGFYVYARVMHSLSEAPDLQRPRSLRIFLYAVTDSILAFSFLDITLQGKMIHTIPYHGQDPFIGRYAVFVTV